MYCAQLIEWNIATLDCFIASAIIIMNKCEWVHSIFSVCVESHIIQFVI